MNLRILEFYLQLNFLIETRKRCEPLNCRDYLKGSLELSVIVSRTHKGEPELKLSEERHSAKCQLELAPLASSLITLAREFSLERETGTKSVLVMERVQASLCTELSDKFAAQSCLIVFGYFLISTWASA